MIAYDALNGNQRLAVDWDEGPLLVLAGPGSGKTLVLTLRIARLIRETPGRKFRVLGLTFTNKAADEMRRRVADELGAEAHRPRLTTFHEYALTVLRRHGGWMGLHPNLTVLTEERDRLLVLRRAFEKIRRSVPSTWSEKGLLRKMEVLMRDGHDPRLDAVPGENDLLRGAYAGYLDLLAEKNCVDFSASLILCHRLFRERPVFARDQRVIYPFVCVDEYQDVNRAQDRLLRTVYPDRNANLFVVADDDQTIYEWNGASPRLLKELTAHFEMQVVQLPESFRCPAPVLRMANSLMRYDRDRMFEKAPLTSRTEGATGNTVRVVEFADDREEARWIATDIRSRAEPGQCAVLGRSRRAIEPVANALRDAGLEVYVSETRQDFETPLLRVVESVLRLADAPAHAEHLAALCQGYRDLVGAEIDAITIEAESALTGKALLATFVCAAEGAGDGDGTRVLTAIREHVLGSARYDRFAAAVFAWAEKREGGAEWARRHPDEEWEVRAWQEMDRNLRLAVGERPALSRFLEELGRRPRVRPVRGGEVRCLTIHAAKGLEFDHVYVVGLAEEELPSYRAVERGGEAIREERRTCFVAITRASRSLTLTHARRYHGWRREPSRFLVQMGAPKCPAPDSGETKGTTAFPRGDGTRRAAG